MGRGGNTGSGGFSSGGSDERGFSSRDSSDHGRGGGRENDENNNSHENYGSRIGGHIAGEIIGFFLSVFLDSLMAACPFWFMHSLSMGMAAEIFFASIFRIIPDTGNKNRRFKKLHICSRTWYWCCSDSHMANG